MKQLVTYRPHFRLGLALVAVATVTTVFAIFTQRTYGYDQEVAKLNRLVQSAKVNTASSQTFREGRDFIEAQNWQKAAEKFNDFITSYPKDKDLDAALYWYGYALQKQDRKDEAAVPLVKLISRFPNSSWRREAEALLVVLGRKADVEKGLDRDNCEIKILALQSLFQADEERAIGIVTESLRANPGQCQGFQAAAVSMLGSHGGPRVVPILLDIARNNTDPRLRLTAIKRLGDQHNDQVIDELIKIYDADKTEGHSRPDIARARRKPHANAAVPRCSRSHAPATIYPIRQVAIRYIGELKDFCVAR